MLLAADIEKGRELSKSCTICHNLDPGGSVVVGPNLHGIVGAPIARDKSFGYTLALQRLSGSRWTIQNLNHWLRDPRSFAPGNKMLYPGMSDPQDRMDLIRYLMTLK